MKKVVFTSLAILTLSTTSTFASSNVGVTEGPSVESRGLSMPLLIKNLSGDSIYLRFVAPSDFSGTIK